MSCDRVYEMVEGFELTRIFLDSNDRDYPRGTVVALSEGAVIAWDNGELTWLGEDSEWPAGVWRA